jgi:hypothetical protein
MTRDTVMVEIPSRAATSFAVTRPDANLEDCDRSLFAFAMVYRPPDL